MFGYFKKLSIILIYSILFSNLVYSQISPGELFSGHSQFEGVTNCTKCHEIGKEINQNKCIDCHKEIAKSLQNKNSFHSKNSNQKCVKCHSDHHGKNFRIININENKFDHSQTDFKLNGKHKNIKCRDCHNSSKIKDSEILKFNPQKLQQTYLGLDVNCKSCHEDVHQKQLIEDCQKCHNEEKWKPAKWFNHSFADFKLEGAHLKVGCEKCHPKSEKSLKFKNIEFEKCNSCHTDFHKGKFKDDCESCHNVKSWKDVKSKDNFNHSQTKYPLKGKHLKVSCDECHRKNTPTKFTLPKFEKCNDCHSDFHKGEFKNRAKKGDCEECHEVKGFSPSNFSFVKHNQTKFPILGAHIAILCKDCHKKSKVKNDEIIKFKWDEKINCQTCHDDVHKGKFTSDKIKCENCHSAISWTKLIFNHSITKFTLNGRHNLIKCEKCHIVNGKEKFVFDKFDCESCHEDKHQNQFVDNGITNCAKCHKENSWKDLFFNHNRDSKYKLDGKHENIDCKKCHKEILIKNIKVIQYRGVSSNCKDCHSDFK